MKNNRKLKLIIVFVVLLVGLIVGLYLIQRSQTFRPKAAADSDQLAYEHLFLALNPPQTSCAGITPSITLTWTPGIYAPRNASENENFIILKNGNWANAVYVGLATTYTDTNVQAGQNYTYAVYVEDSIYRRAQNAIGFNSNDVQPTPVSVTAPNCNNGTPINSSPSPVTGTAGGNIAALPNPCYIPAGKTVCSADIFWKMTNNSSAKVIVRETGSLFAQAPSGSQNAPWISQTPLHLDLYNSANQMISSVTVQGVPDSNSTKPPRLSASPNPCILSPSGTCDSWITWNFGGGWSGTTNPYSVRIKEVPGSLFAQGGSGMQLAPWISATGATFQLYYLDHVEEELFVKGITEAQVVKKGDANGDGKIDILDFNQLVTYFGQSSTSHMELDFNYNGTIDLFDFNAFLTAFRQH